MELRTDDLPPQLRAKITELKKARDEVQVRLHLATLEAKNRWNELESKLVELEKQAAAEGNSTKQATLELAQNLLSSVRQFRDRLKQ